VGVDLVFDTLTADEVSTAYGLLAESVSCPEDFSSVTYRLRPQAKFHAGDARRRDLLVQRFHTLDQRQANADAPPFEEIAKRPNFSETGLATFLLDPHSKMPNMNLSRTEAADIAAYVHRLQ
jgi:hypothetical protein